MLAVPEAKSCAELGWRLQPGDLSVCGGSKVLYGACASGDFDAAAEICTAAGARLCTVRGATCEHAIADLICLPVLG